MNVLEAIEVLEEARRLGVHLVAVDDRVVYAPKPLATPDLLDRIRKHEEAILAILRGVEPLPNAPIVCPECPSKSFWLPKTGSRWLCSTCTPPPDLSEVVVGLRYDGDDMILDVKAS